PPVTRLCSPAVPRLSEAHVNLPEEHQRAVEADHLAPVARRVEVELGRIEAAESLRLEQVGENDPGALETVGEVEDLRDGVEAVGDAERRGDQARVVTLAGAQHLPEIALLRL